MTGTRSGLDALGPKQGLEATGEGFAQRSGVTDSVPDEVPARCIGASGPKAASGHYATAAIHAMVVGVGCCQLPSAGRRRDPR